MASKFQEIINNTIIETGGTITLKSLSDLESLKKDMHSSYLFINTTGVGMEPMLERSVVPDASYFKPDLKVIVFTALHNLEAVDISSRYGIIFCL